RRSATICTARAFSSSGYRFDDFVPTCPSFPTEELSGHAGADHSAEPPKFECDSEVAQPSPKAAPELQSLEGLLRRIPLRWPRCIDVGPGWHLLIIATDARLAAIDPNYVLLQVKEKFGALRYYCQPSGEDPATDLWEMLESITDQAERTSVAICEQCGKSGTLVEINAWLKTLCQECVDEWGGHQRAR
ncbi:hypothetical protein KUF57_25740, partial [Mycolicibacterium sp. PAM1]|nr:hypothetical protein [Mycolicibacterium sp. PAM1]